MRTPACEILITETPDEQPHKDEEKAKLSDIAEVTVVQHPSREDLLKPVEDVDVIMTDFGRIDREVFDRAQKNSSTSPCTEWATAVWTWRGVVVSSSPGWLRGGQRSRALPVPCARLNACDGPSVSGHPA